MLNHARTLLLNAKPGPFGVYPGEEVVPESFLPVPLDSALTSVRQTLFGAKPDRLMLNYRARQLLAVVHSSELRDFIFRLDPRITYDPQDATLYRHRFELTARQWAGSPVAVYLGGEPAEEAADVTGVCRTLWRAAFNGDGTITVLRRTPPTAETETTPELENGLSEPIALPGSGFHFRYTPTSSVYWETFSEEQWEAFTENQWEGFGESELNNPVIDFQSDIRPRRDPSSLLASLDSLGEPTIARLFGVGSPAGVAEPLKTLLNLWTSSREPQYRLGAAVLALIYRTESLRIGDG